MQNIPRWKKSDRGSSHFRHGLDPRLGGLREQRVSVQRIVLVNYRVAGGVSLHHQKFVFRRIRKKIRQRCRKTSNADELSPFQRIPVDDRLRCAGSIYILTVCTGVKRNVVVKSRRPQIYVRRVWWSRAANCFFLIFLNKYIHFIKRNELKLK